MTFWYVARLRVLQCLGLAFLFIPANTVAYVGIRPEQSNDVSGLTNLARNIGGSVGTSLFTTMLARREQVHQHDLVRHAGPGHPGYAARIATLTQQSMGKVASSVDAQHQALARFYHELQQQASVLSYIDVLSLLAVLSVAAAPLALMLKRPPKGAAAPVGH
jgi:DHA2 family multidrug resistance protein